MFILIEGMRIIELLHSIQAGASSGGLDPEGIK
jgi:hypothetical protein